LRLLNKKLSQRIFGGQKMNNYDTNRQNLSPVKVNFVRVSAIVARWFTFKPKIPIWENFSGPQIGK
jgi:hypothetical protein